LGTPFRQRGAGEAGLLGETHPAERRQTRRIAGWRVIPSPGRNRFHPYGRIRGVRRGRDSPASSRTHGLARDSVAGTESIPPPRGNHGGVRHFSLSCRVARLRRATRTLSPSTCSYSGSCRYRRTWRGSSHGAGFPWYACRRRSGWWRVASDRLHAKRTRGLSLGPLYCLLRPMKGGAGVHIQLFHLSLTATRWLPQFMDSVGRGLGSLVLRRWPLTALCHVARPRSILP